MSIMFVLGMQRDDDEAQCRRGLELRGRNVGLLSRR